MRLTVRTLGANYKINQRLKCKKKYYVEVLELTEKGLPPRKGLERLGLDFVIPEMEKRDAVE